MEPVEFTLPAKAWEGLVTQYPADTKLVGSDQFTEGSFNFVTDSTGCIAKRPDGIDYNVTAFPTPPKDQYEAVFSSGIRHMLVMENGNLRYSSGGGTFAMPVNGSGFATTGNMEFALYRNRVYFGNGLDAPAVYDLATSYGAVTYTAPQVKAMGAQTPVSAPSTAIAAGGSVPVGAHTYKVTFLYYDAEESNGGPASGVATTTGGNQTVNLTAIPIGGYGVTARKIYRDDNNGVYVLVGTLSDNTTVIFSDTAALGTLPIPTNNALPPLFSLIEVHRDRLWMAGITDDPSRLYWSEAGQPNIVRVNNSILCNPRDPITAIYVYQDRVIVFNRNSMGQILGSTSADFRYSEINPTVGCADNRSVKTRTLRGVPTLVWLATDNFYQFNGSSINRISEEIENLVQLNIQQALQVKGKQTQTSQADFLAGTSSPGINLVSSPGNITTRGYMKAGDSASLTTNPTKVWDTEAEWEGGSVVSNIATNLSNQISVPTKHAPTLEQGTNNNTFIVSNTLRTPTSTDFTGETTAVGTTTPGQLNNDFASRLNWVATRIIPTRSGTITSIDMRTVVYYPHANINSKTIFVRTAIHTDNLGTVGSQVAHTTQSFIIPSGSGPAQEVEMPLTTTSFPVTAGTAYWIVLSEDPATEPNSIFRFIRMNAVPLSAWTGNYNSLGRLNTSTWAPIEHSLTNDPVGAMAGQYTLVASPASTSGLWIGPTYDTYANAAVPDTVTHTGVYPSGASAVTTVEAAHDAGFTSGLLTQSFNNLNGSGSVTITDRRYWRIKIQLSTTDDRVTAQAGAPTLKYQTTGTWESEAIDHTTDITTLDLLSIVGTGGVAEIATSDDNISYSSYTAVGSATPKRYSKVRVTLTTDVDNITSQVVTSATLNWSLIANLVSSAIDTASTPAGWDLFQASLSLNSGTVSFDVRTASTLGGLTSATWVPVANAAFITATPEQYIQYRATISSSANAVPSVASVTINWLIQNVNSIRVASLFYNGQYYLAAAEFDSSYNNLVFMFDEDNTWKLFRGLTINTLGTFFTDAYYGSSTVGRMVKFFQEIAQPIEMDVRTKAFSHEIGDESKTKFLRKLVLKYTGTGCRITPSYSVDGGLTFYDLKNVTTGLTYLDTASDNKLALTRFVPTGETITAGKTLLFRLYNNDDKAVQIHSLRATCWISPREVL